MVFRQTQRRNLCFSMFDVRCSVFDDMGGSVGAGAGEVPKENYKQTRKSWSDTVQGALKGRGRSIVLFYSRVCIPQVRAAGT